MAWFKSSFYALNITKHMNYYKTMLIPGFSSASVNLWVNMWRVEKTKEAGVGAVHSSHTP